MRYVKKRWTNEQFIEAVQQADSWAEVIRKLGLKPGGGIYVTFPQLAKDLNVDTSHMTGKLWSKGKTNDKDSRIRRTGVPLATILTLNSSYQSTHSLKKRLIREGIKTHQCEICKTLEWLGKPVPIQLDHINGNRTDNRIENLRILCPNCHAQTETYCAKNKKVLY